jgi:hypothetical protein
VDRIDARTFLGALVGVPLETLTGRPNRVLRLDQDDVIVATSRSAGGRRVPVAWVQDALDRLVAEGAVEISVPSVGYRSAFIGAALSRVSGAVAADGWVRLSHAEGSATRPEAVRTWVFQATPGTFDLRAALDALERMTWLVRTHRRDIHAGDRAYLWTAGDGGGILAVATVLDEPSMRAAEPSLVPFVRDAALLEGQQPRVTVAVDAVLEEPILRASLLHDPVLAGLAVIRARQGTNFRVTQGQARSLVDLLGSAGPDAPPVADAPSHAVRTDDGLPLDAHFSLTRAGDGYTIVFGARWGRRGRSDAGNSDYGPGLRILVGRLAELGAVLVDATVESARVQALPHDERVIDLGVPFPVDLGTMDPEDVRLRIGHAQASVGRAPGARGGGNFTRRIALQVRLPSDVRSEAELVAWLGSGTGGEIAEAEAAVEVVAGRRRGQGFATSAAERAALEHRGMVAVREALAADGWVEIVDVSTRRSYDLHCRRPGEELRVEVKATRRSDEEVLVTRNEVIHARTHAVHLAVVSGVRVEVDEHGAVTATGGIITWHRPWHPSDADLTALAYRWRRPS